ncbi:hypothetical protein CALCODRAFT_522155, partial [Calocera cornea HHB12733]
WRWVASRLLAARGTRGLCRRTPKFHVAGVGGGFPGETTERAGNASRVAPRQSGPVPSLVLVTPVGAIAGHTSYRHAEASRSDRAYGRGTAGRTPIAVVSCGPIIAYQS